MRVSTVTNAIDQIGQYQRAIRLFNADAVLAAVWKVTARPIETLVRTRLPTLAGLRGAGFLGYS